MVKQKKPRGSLAAIIPQDAITDPRFASFTTDPRFRLPSKKYTRTKIDKRFSRMLKDDDFANTAKVDKYGRKLNIAAKKEALQRLYQPEEEDEDENQSTGSDGSDGSDVEVEDDEIIERELKKFGDKGYDPARGGGFLSSSDDDEDDEEDEDGGVEVEAVAEFPDMQIEQAGVPMGEITSRIAAVNLDWDNIKAADLMAVFASFLKGAGKIEKVVVYKSDFGRERMEREEMEGPPKEIFAKKIEADKGEHEVDSEDDSEDEEEVEEDEDDDDDEKIKKELLKEDDGQEFDNAALRQYQLERLRYYYAVIVCSDKETANYIYEATDGTEYLSSANFLDLRFIPDDVEFDDKPRDECHKVPAGYKPTEFVTDALQHSKVKLTWDAEDTERKEVIKRAFSGSRAAIGENDLRAYLGSESSEDEDEEVSGEEATDMPKVTKKELARQKMRAALGLADEPAASKKVDRLVPVGDMEITFTAGLSSKTKGGVFENEPIKEETTAEAYIRKEKERKARRKEKSRALREGQDPDANKDTANKADTPTPEEQPTFDDPFFTTDEAAQAKVTKNLRKEERQKKREAKAAEEAQQASHRAELELLMAENSATIPADRLDHFDINEIQRAEKDAKKKKSRQRSKKGKGDKMHAEDGDGKRGGLQTDFKMDVSDPRFAAVFEKHEFAIDPSNPKYKATEGMKKLLEEGRRKRKAGGVEDGDAEVERVDAHSGKGKKQRNTDDNGGGGNGKKQRDTDDNGGGGNGKAGSADLRGLVESVKKKARR